MTDKELKHDPGLAKVVERQMRNWELARTQMVETAAQRLEVADFVTIANIVGAGGHDVAALLAEKLRWPIFDRAILTMMAGDDEVLERLYSSMDERDLGWLENTCRSLMQAEFRKNDYFSRLCQTILSLARKGPAIFIGRSADLILPQNRGLRIKVIASLCYCTANFARNNNISPPCAAKQVERIENERREFIRHHFHIDAYELTRFDMLLNVERLATPQAVELILGALRLKGIIH